MMKYASWMIKPASSACNLRCRYCFYADVAAQRKVPNYGIMSQENRARMLEHVFAPLADGDDLTLAFQGGEPTLAGLEFYRGLVKWIAGQAKKVTVHYALQTNGILLDDAWCAFLAENHFLVGLSMDGDTTLHNANRVDAEGKGTFERVLQAKKCLEKYGVQYNVLCTLTAGQARYPQRLWDFFCRQNIRYLQFTPCLASLEAESPEPWALTPERFASFYNQMFALWKNEFLRGNYISVKFFDDIFNLLCRQTVTACGFAGQCHVQNIVEADGSVYPCDFYVLDDWRLGSVLTTSPEELEHSSAATRFLARERTDAAICKDCAWRGICHGGCPRMAHSMYFNQAGTFCGYRSFLQQNWEEIKRVAAYLSRQNGI